MKHTCLGCGIKQTEIIKLNESLSELWFEAGKMKQERVIIPYRQPSLSLLTSAMMINNLSSVHSFI